MAVLTREAVRLAAWFTAACALLAAPTASAHLAYQPKCKDLRCIERSQERNLAHARYVVAHGAHKHRRWALKAVVWLKRELDQTWVRMHPPEPVRVLSGGPANVIAAAEEIASHGGNPWPMCPDPIHDGASWQDTKDCESPGYSWYEDPPGYFCGPLQFDPAFWADVIRRYGIPC